MTTPNTTSIFSILILTLIFIACKEEFADKGLVLLEPNAKAIGEVSFVSDDSIKLEMMYKGMEPVLYISVRTLGEVFVPENANNDGFHEYSYQTDFFWTRHYHIENNQPFTLSWALPQDWSPQDINPLIVQLSRTLLIRVVTENHILDYQYELSAE